MSEGNFYQRLKAKFSEPPTQPSLFHYIREGPRPSIWDDFDWSFLRHPIKTFKEDWRAPAIQASLFHADELVKHKEPFSWKEFVRDLFTGFRGPVFIPSVFSDPTELMVEQSQLRTKRMEAGALSVFVHIALAALMIFVITKAPEPIDGQQDDVVMVTNPVYLPFEGDGRDGGGGGGGGKGEQAPPATGRMPETARFQLVAPDPTDPQPLAPAEDLMSATATVVMPIDIPQDPSLPIGDITAPPNYSRSSGPGSGGGIGTGTGTGVGSGKGPGVGPGSGGGMGGGSGGGIGSGVGPYVAGNGVSAPVAIVQPLPAYTEEARKARAEGIVMIQAIIRRNGTVDSFKVIRGLGYGLDESAIQTIASKWRFKPGTLNGVPVDVQANIEVSFRLY
jgi:periplasmic protein TonB